VDAARFATGMSYEQYKAQMTRNRDALEEIEAGVKVDPRDVTHFRSLKPLHVVALVEDWCGDVVANLPVVAALVHEAGPALDLRCFLKEENRDLIDRYLHLARFESLPVFAFFDEGWREVGVMIERPTAVTERQEDDRRRIYAGHPEFGSPDDSPSKLPDELRARLRSLMTESRRDWKSWAERQLIHAIRDCTTLAPQIGERVPHQPVSARATIAARS